MAFITFWVLVITGGECWLRDQSFQYRLEHQMVDGTAGSFWRTANFAYQQDYVIPPSLLPFCDEATREKFLRVTELDFQLDNLENYDPEKIRYYAQLKYVHTIKLHNRCVPWEMVEVLKSFPNLRRIEYIWDRRLENSPIRLDADRLPGIEFVILR